MNQRKSQRKGKAKENEDSQPSMEEIQASDDLGVARASPSSTQQQSADLHSTHGSNAGSNDCDHTASDFPPEDDPLSNVLLRVEVLEEANRQKDQHIKLLYGEIDLLKKSKKQQSDQQTDLTIRSMNHNIIISGKNSELDEPKGRIATENCKQIVEKILNDFVKMQAGKVRVVRAHRLGYGAAAGKARPSVARLEAREQVGEVMKRCGQLAGTDIYINPQYPQSVEERRQFIQSYRKASKDNGATAKISVDKLYVNNELRRDLLPPTLPSIIPPSVIDLPIPKLSQIKSNDAMRMQMAVIDTKSPEDIANGLSSVLLKSRSTPDSIVYAFRHTLGTAVRRNYDSGSDPGVGLRLLKMLDTRDVRNQTAIMYIWYKQAGKSKGSQFYDLVEESLDDLT